MFKKSKIAIIGGGVVGLYLALKLSKNREVTVFEKERGAGINKPCSGLFSKRILDFIPESKSLIENRIKSVFIHFPRKTVEVRFSKEFLVMDHEKLDKLVFKLVKKVGARIKFNYKIKFLPKDFDGIIGCDGANSIVRKKLKLKDPKFKLGILGFVKEKSDDNFVEVWPLKEGGFIWKVPRGKETEYGIISDLRIAAKKFNVFLKENNISLEKKSRLIPQGIIIPSNKSVTLCGDAAGLTKPWSGGGVIWGLTAANILLKNFPDFIAYKKDIRKFFILKIIFSKIAVNLVYYLGFNIPWLLPKKNEMESDFLTRFFKRVK